MSINSSRLKVLANLRPVNEHDFEEILGWLEKRGLPKAPLWTFSTKGFITPGVAVGFLYLTNSSIAYIDCYISNPEAKLEDRKKAFDRITDRILSTAKNGHNVKLICCNTKVSYIEKLAESFGFKYDGKVASYAKIL